MNMWYILKKEVEIQIRKKIIMINKDCTLQLKPTNYISDKNTEVNTKIIINIKAQDKKG